MGNEKCHSGSVSKSFWKWPIVTQILDSIVTDEESGISNKMHRLASKLWWSMAYP